MTLKIISKTNMNSALLSEYAARVCYNTTDKIGKVRGFIPKLIKRGHMSVFEHWTMTVFIEEVDDDVVCLISKPGVYSKLQDGSVYVTVNARHLLELDNKITKFLSSHVLDLETSYV